MNIFTRVKEFFMNLFKTNAEEAFNVNIISSDLMEMAQTEWQNIIKGRPYWRKENVHTINFAKFLCYYTSKKTCLDLNVTISGRFEGRQHVDSYFCHGTESPSVCTSGVNSVQ